MIDLKNSYIVNDNGPLLKAWLKEASKQGLNPRKRDTAWLNEAFVFMHTVDGILGADTCDNHQRIADKEELALKDFMPKKTKTEYVKVDMSPKDIARAMLDGEVFYNKDGEHSYKWSGIGFVNTRGHAIYIQSAFYRKVETEIQWYDDITEPVPCKVWHNRSDAPRLRYIKGYKDRHYVADDGVYWLYATPLTAEDLLENF